MFFIGRNYGMMLIIPSNIGQFCHLVISLVNMGIVQEGADDVQVDALTPLDLPLPPHLLSQFARK